MQTTAQTSTNPFCWAELSTAAVQEAKQFYADLYGFAYTDMDTPSGPYTVIEPSNGHGGGIMSLVPDTPSAWMPYIQVDRLEPVVERAEAAGATTTLPPSSLEDGARIAWLTDPDGARFGLYEAGTDSPPTPQADPAGAPHFCFFELSTESPERARAFYSAIFDWSISTTRCSDTDYDMIRSGENEIGGIQTQAHGPAVWMPYVKVPDVATALAGATDRGAREIVPTRSIGGGMIAVFADPHGAALGLFAVS